MKNMDELSYKDFHGFFTCLVILAAGVTADFEMVGLTTALGVIACGMIATYLSDV